MQLQHYIFMIVVLLIIIALVLYKFFPRFRKNSFQMEINEEMKADFSKGISDFFTPLEQRYTKKLASGEAILIKGTGKSKSDDWQTIKFWTWAIFISGLLILLFKSFFPIVNGYFHQCLSNASIAVSIWSSVMFLSFMHTVKDKLTESISKIKLGRKTGWDGDIHKVYENDIVIFKYTKAKEKQYFLDILLSIIFAVLFSTIILFFIFFTLEPLSFMEMKEAFRQCIG